MCRLDDLSHCLFWAFGAVSPGQVVTVSEVELPRLQLRFAVRTCKETGVSRLFSCDYDGYFLSQRASCAVGLAQLGSRAQRCSRALQQRAVVLEQDRGGLAFLAPNFQLKRPGVRDRPFSTSCVALKHTAKVSTSAKTHFLLPVHPSRTYVQPTSLAASLYFFCCAMLSREYSLAVSLLPSLSTDARFSHEERQFWAMLGQLALTDAHPDGIALRLAIVQLGLDCGEAEPEGLDVHADHSEYVRKWNHVSALARLTREDDRALARQLADARRAASQRAGIRLRIRQRGRCWRVGVDGCVRGSRCVNDGECSMESHTVGPVNEYLLERIVSYPNRRLGNVPRS